MKVWQQFFLKLHHFLVMALCFLINLIRLETFLFSQIRYSAHLLTDLLILKDFSLFYLNFQNSIKGNVHTLHIGTDFHGQTHFLCKFNHRGNKKCIIFYYFHFRNDSFCSLNHICTPSVLQTLIQIIRLHPQTMPFDFLP